MVKIINTHKLSENQGSDKKPTTTMIFCHSTATPNGTAETISGNEKRNPDNSYVHFVVDDTGAYAVGEVGYIAWGAMSPGNEMACLQVELCEFTDHARAMKAYANYVELLAAYGKKLGCAFTLNDSSHKTGFKYHNWVTYNIGVTDHTDPTGYFKSLGITDAQFLADLKAGKSGAKVTASKPASKTATKPAAKTTTSHSGVWFQVPAGATAERGKYINGDTEIKVRYDSPSTHAPAVADALPPFGTFEYDSFRKAEGYTWIHHMYQDRNIWVPVRIWHGSSSTPYGTFK